MTKFDMAELPKLIEALRHQQEDSLFELAADVIEQLAKDSQRLDAMEADLDVHGPIILHNGEGTKGNYRGLGLKNTGRTLRQAIDEYCDMREMLKK